MKPISTPKDLCPIFKHILVLTLSPRFRFKKLGETPQ